MDALSLFMILASSIPTGQLIAVIALAAACVAFGVTDIVLFATRNKAKDESLAESEASADAEEPAQEEPAQEEPAQEEPAQEEPAQEEPAQEEPAQEEPVQEDELVVAAVAETDDEEDEGEEEEDEDDDDFESDDDDIEDIFVDEPAADQTDENGVIIPVPLFPAEEKKARKRKTRTTTISNRTTTISRISLLTNPPRIRRMKTALLYPFRCSPRRKKGAFTCGIFSVSAPNSFRRRPRYSNVTENSRTK